jgi:hypothetical protein
MWLFLRFFSTKSIAFFRTAASLLFALRDTLSLPAVRGIGDEIRHRFVVVETPFDIQKGVPFGEERKKSENLQIAINYCIRRPLT